MGSFQDLLNAMRGNYKGEMPSIKSMLTGDYKGEIPMPQEPQQPDFRVPSQMPGAYNMGPGIDHGITGNLSDIQNRPFDYGMKGDLKQMPYRGGTPTLTEFGQGLEALKKGKERGGVMNDSTYEALQMLQGY
tara:strand:- start:248 stop:643 length:396 start_codon:yes stop_codon:yes gene_type:complete